ncbi:hypothetical protein ACIREO_03340 [Streptomyces sp. NPDC102441]|uniref:hypothetical protein n=1 Tax=Streptomyces sp. NPDC102441 TaxID=3366176 RepID=UPI00382F79E3
MDSGASPADPAEQEPDHRVWIIGMVRSGPICSLCRSLDQECGDVCRKEPAAGPVLMPLPVVRTPAG